MVHIGKIIKQAVKERGLSVTEFAKRINTHRRNVYDIFKRESLDTALLQKIVNVLECDFFSYFNKDNSEEAENFNEPVISYKKVSKDENSIKQLSEKLESYQKEIDYLKQLLNEKEKIITLLETKK